MFKQFATFKNGIYYRDYQNNMMRNRIPLHWHHILVIFCCLLAETWPFR